MRLVKKSKANSAKVVNFSILDFAVVDYSRNLSEIDACNHVALLDFDHDVSSSKGLSSHCLL